MDNTKRKNENGAALLLALGLLALLLVMVMSFATTALLEREVADSASGGSVGRALAQSALNRCLSSIRYCIGKNISDQNLDRFDRFVSWDGTDTPDTASYDENSQYYNGLKDAMDTKWAGQDLYAYPSATPDRCPRWQYVKDADGRIIGRVAYAVLPDIGQMNVAGLRSSATQPAREGVDTAEFDISKIGFGDSAKIRERANTKKSPVKPDSFFSFAEEFSNDDIVKTDYALVKQFFVFSKSYAPADEEKYWMGDDKTNHVQYFHRFNLGRTDTMTVDQLLGSPDPFYKSAYPDIKDTKTAAIPFLRVVAAESGTFSDLIARRRQIAANLIDYCDTDSVPNSDAAQPWTLSSAPTYTGNEKTDYIYEVGFEVGIIKPTGTKYSDSGFAISGSEAKFSLGVLPVVKLVNLYESPTAVAYSFSNSLTKLAVKGQLTKCKIKVTYSIVAPPFSKTVTWDFDVPDGVAEFDISLASTLLPKKDPLPITRTNTDPFIFSNSDDYEKGGFIVAGPTLDAGTIATLAEVQKYDGTATGVSGTEFISIEKAKLTEISLTVGNMLLSDTVGGVDFVKGPLAELKWSDSTGKTLVSPFRLAVGCLQGKDPRQNLNAGDWDCTHVVADTDSAKVLSATTNTCDDANPPDGSNASFDNESLAGGDVSKLATADIANLPIANFDQLGYIHRGAKWETLKLSNAGGNFNQDGYKYDTHALNTAGTTYADGDGGILNQVKIKPDNYIYGRINLNTKNEKLWQGLFSGITYEDPSKIPSAQSFDSDKLAKKIVEKLTAGNIWFDNRAYLMRPLNNIDSTNTETNNLLDQALADAGITLLSKQKEEIIGKIMHLLKTEAYPEEFQVLIVAQSIKDFGGETVVQGAQLGRFDFTNTAPNINDEITSTVKYLARVRRDGKELTIVNLQCIREADEK